MISQTLENSCKPVSSCFETRLTVPQRGGSETAARAMGKHQRLVRADATHDRFCGMELITTDECHPRVTPSRSKIEIMRKAYISSPIRYIEKNR